MLSKSRDVRHIGSPITADNYAIDIVKEFIYLGFANTTKYDVSAEIKLKIDIVSRCYRCYSPNRQSSNRDLSRMTKLKLYKTIDYPPHSS